MALGGTLPLHSRASRDDGKNPDATQIDLTVSVPAGLAIEAQSADGDIAVSQIEAKQKEAAP